MPLKIALIGEFNESVTAHKAISIALKLEAEALDRKIETYWLDTQDLTDVGILSEFDAGWAVPASPYANMDNAISAIRYFRENGKPFLGTCGGYQHALVDFARNVLGFGDAGITEIDPDCPMPLVSSLVCALIEEQAAVMPVPGSLLANLTGPDPLRETYRCSFGLNPDFSHIFDNTALKIAAYDSDSAVRAMELEGHPFFLGTAFQPERAALEGRRHAVISGFVSAAENTDMV